MTVFYGDYEEGETMAAVEEAVVEFAKRTNIYVNVLEYRHMDWESRDGNRMGEQVTQLYPDSVGPTNWALMIYCKTKLEWVFQFLTGFSVEGLAQVGGSFCMVNRLKPKLIVHELYHLGYGIESNRTVPAQP
jgi:hypothetical protein